MTLLAIFALILALIPALLLAVNLAVYRRLPRFNPDAPLPTPVSLLIPARNEESTIATAVHSALAAAPGDSEVIVLDDHSTDRTAAIVSALAAVDSRVRLVHGQPLPEGWCGKQHACWQLARHARHPLLLFVDADVRLAPGAAARLAAKLDRRPDLALLSGVPHQQTESFLERLLIPLIHFVLLGYLPLPAARRSRWTAFAAGCGQLFMARREAYFAAGGHQALRASLHDGLKLPRAFRAAGFRTDLVDATDLATCRMYASATEVWRGLSKNATEGLAHPVAILPWTLLLLGGHVAPWLLIAVCLVTGNAATPGFQLAAAAAVVSILSRLVAAWGFSQSRLGAALHPLGIAVLVVIQWCALARSLRGRPAQWRGRSYPPAGTLPTHNAISSTQA